MFDPFSSLAVTRGEWVSELHHKVLVKKPNQSLCDMARLGNYHPKPDVRATDGSGRHVPYWEAGAKL